jgi:glycerol-3-phosphate dehydrogenase subunit B
MPTADVVVIGAGLAGLSCGVELAERGARVFVAAKGMAATHWSHGGIDVAAPPGVRTPRAGVAELVRIAGHPYGLLTDDVEAALTRHLGVLAAAGLPYVGDLDAALTPIATAIGTRRPAAILPAAQSAALAPWASDEGLLLIGFESFRDAWPRFAASMLRRAGGLSIDVQAVEVRLPGLEDLHNVNALVVARRFDDAAWRRTALAAIAGAVPAGRWRIGLPAVLGLADHAAVLADAQAAFGHPVVEMPGLPPSVPGLRLFEALRSRLLAAGGRFQFGFPVVDVEREGRRIIAVHTEGASRTMRLVAAEYVLATGGIGGAGIRALPDGTLQERVFGLPVEAPPAGDWFADDPLAPQPLDVAGIRVDAELRPVGGGIANVRVIGSALAGMRYLDERCGDGVAIASAHRAARRLSGERPGSVRTEAVA